jgi:hypothetical protein
MATRKISTCTLDRIREFQKRWAYVSPIPTERAYGNALSVLIHFLGKEWVRENLENQRSRSKAFLRTRLDGVYDKESDEAQLHVFRVIDLGEMLFNSQAIEGFDVCVERLGSGDVESAFAELEVGKILGSSKVWFRFVRPFAKRRGEDYDLDIMFPEGHTACAETKCKVESTQQSAKTVLTALSAARRQLPKHMPGIIFIKVPEAWVVRERDGGTEVAEIGVANAIQEFLRNSGRIVGVELYSTHFQVAGEQAWVYLPLAEFLNPASPFFGDGDWRISKRTPDVSAVLPVGWIHLESI